MWILGLKGLKNQNCMKVNTACMNERYKEKENSLIN